MKKKGSNKWIRRFLMVLMLSILIQALVLGAITVKVTYGDWLVPVEGRQLLRELAVPVCISVTLASIFIVLKVALYIDRKRKEQREKEQKENEIKSLYMQQLQEALEKAKCADAAKTSFLSKLSHDIRTPLNGIIGLLEIDEKHADDRKLVDENRGKIKVAAKHLQALLSDVLELTKLEDKSVHLVEEPFDILELATDVLTMVNLKANEAGINVIHQDCALQVEKPYVYGSPVHVRQVMLNIFDNAVKFNKPGGSVCCSVQTVSVEEETVTYKVKISDTGIGMSPQFIEHLFEPFAQEHSDSRSVYQGTGLGMAIVKSLVDKMGGEIEVYSEEGVGSNFEVTIPFRIADKENLPEKISDGNVDLQGLRILVAEDNQLNMEIAESILTDAGAVVTKAYNGEEAVELFHGSQPDSFDVILMDLMMPVMDGYQATAAIRSMNRLDGQQIPIIAMTANAFAEDARRCMVAGMNGHLTKPIEVSRFMQTMLRYVKKK